MKLNININIKTQQMRLLCFGLIALSLGQNLTAQTEQKSTKDFGFEAYGWVSGQYFYDTRQTGYSREGLLSYYGLPKSLDENGKDINARPTSNFNLSTSRIGMKIYSPDVFGAKIVGQIEGDFTGQSDANIHLFRLRQANITLDWGNTKLLIGHAWSALFLPEMVPSMQDLHTGGPFHPFSRTNQVRLDQKLCSDLKLVATAGFQRDYSSYGVNSARSPFNQINSNIPEFNLQLHYKKDNLFAGLGGEYKAVRPRTDYTLGTKKYAQDNLVHSFAATAFANYKNDFLDIKLQGLWGQNMNDYMMLGGFVESIFDSINNEFTYTPTQIASCWIDIAYPKGVFRPALFLGYQKNLGYNSYFAVENFYGVGKDIDNIFRIAPRLEIYPNKALSFIAGVEYTAAAYGLWEANTAKVVNSEYVGNFRLSLAFCYKFNTGRI
ncbi:MAG: hypothetical protein H6Q15_1691 [Bacteroidetes bacterium]|nr:hypothetical protein [Bacteroidota bacterium]